MEYIWIVFALLSALMASLVAIFGKIGLQGIDTNTATTIRAVIMALFLIGVIAIQGKLHNVQPILENSKAFLFIILSGIAGALSWLFYFIALKGAKISQIVPLDRLSVVFALLFAFFLLGEHISIKAGIGAALMVVGGVLVALG
ncbi:MAG: EamA family transporter [Candidatus Woesearchaeota archaeon]